MSLPRFIVPTERLAGNDIALSGRELHHLKVQRLRRGDRVVLIDGHGMERQGIVDSISRVAARIQLDGHDELRQEPGLSIVLAQALIKPERLELAIEKATELGVSRIVLFNSERTVSNASPNRLSRWQRIIDGAAKQSGRSVIPTLTGPLGFADLIAGPDEPLRLILWENAPLSATMQSILSDDPSSLQLLIGPEGGFTDAEATAAIHRGYKPLSLGSRPLRSETAALVAITLAQYRWGALAS